MTKILKLDHVQKSACCRAESSTIGETANRVGDKQCEKKKKEKKKTDQTVEFYPVRRVNVHPENLKQLAHNEREKERVRKREKERDVVRIMNRGKHK